LPLIFHAFIKASGMLRFHPYKYADVLATIFLNPVCHRFPLTLDFDAFCLPPN